MTEYNKDDLLGELLADDVDPEDGEPRATGDVDALKTQVESLEKEKLGLLQATKEERRKRQERDMRLSKIEGVLDTILSQRQQQGMESVTESQAAEARKAGLPVEYDDDGNGWVDMSQLNELLTPYEQKIRDLERRLQFTDSKHEAADAAEKVRQAIISENEQYAPAANRYRAARKWVEDAVVDFSRANGIQQPLTSGQALSMVFDRQLRNEFAEEFSDLDLIDIVTAEDSEDHFRRALSSIAKTLTPAEELPEPKDKMDSRFQRVLNKPSNLGSQPNAKAGQLSIYEKVNSLSAEDIVDLSDDQINALLKAAGREESEY